METNSNDHRNLRTRVTRYTDEEIALLLKVSDNNDIDDFVASDEEQYVPISANNAAELSDMEEDFEIERDEEYDSDESIEDGPSSQNIGSTWKAKDCTEWYSVRLTSSQTIARNIMRQKGGPAARTNLLKPKNLFKSIITPEMCDIILRMTNRKAKQVFDDYNNNLNTTNSSQRQTPRTFEPFTEIELDAFLGILIISGVHRNNKENITEMWKPDTLPIIRAAMSRDRFLLMTRFIRFDNASTRAERSLTDKAAPIRELWTMLNSNLQMLYKPKECITTDEQLFPFRGHTKFTQYIPSKPAKYGIKIFWACDSDNAFPLQGQIYTGKPADGPRQTNIGGRTVLDLVSAYKRSGRNITTDNFFTSLELAKALKSWDMTLVGTVRKNKTFLPSNMQPSKERALLSTNFAYNKDVTICSYVPKKNKAVILLSSMHTQGDVDESLAAKPEIIKYYNKTKGGVDTMDKMLSEYTVKRKTLRWPLAFFFNMVDVSGLAAYIIYKENNANLKKADLRRHFLKSLGKELCLPSIELRKCNPLIMRSHALRAAVEMVVGCKEMPIAQPNDKPLFGSRGPTPVAGRCYVCRELKKKDRKTRKCCTNCKKPVCDEHSESKVFCMGCQDV